MPNKTPITYTTIESKGRQMTPATILATGVITLYPPKYAKRLYLAGTIGILSADMWAKIQAAKGGNWNVESAYID